MWSFVEEFLISLASSIIWSQRKLLKLFLIAKNSSLCCNYKKYIVLLDYRFERKNRFVEISWERKLLRTLFRVLFFLCIINRTCVFHNSTILENMKTCFYIPIIWITVDVFIYLYIFINNFVKICPRKYYVLV